MSELNVDTINEQTAANGVSIDGVKLKDSIVEVDTINESTSGSGVTIDGLKIKDQSGTMVNPVLKYWTTGQLIGNDGSAGTNSLEATTETLTDVPNFSLSITPSSTSSKIWVMCNVPIWSTDCPGDISLQSNHSGSYARIAEQRELGKDTGSSGVSGYLTTIISPNTTSAFTVKLQGASSASNSSDRFRINWYGWGELIAMEIGG